MIHLGTLLRIRRRYSEESIWINGLHDPNCWSSGHDGVPSNGDGDRILDAVGNDRDIVHRYDAAQFD